MSIEKGKERKSLMLILTRRIGETINIGNDIKVVVVSIQGKQVQLGIDAPKEVTVHRAEIYERIKQQKVTQA